MSATISVRRIGFSYPEGSMSHLYADGDLIMSHLLAVLSSLFPEGERFFIESVKHYMNDIEDPKLKKDIKGFIGQEVTHGREHDVLNERLKEMGYPTDRGDRFATWILFDLEKKRWMPSTSPKFKLAVTAALEHYTASLAEMILTEPEAQRLMGDSEVRNILNWHALEENEHKAVAFNVFRAVGGTEKTRIRTMRLVNLLFVAILIGLVTASMLKDKAARNPVRVIKSLHTLWKSPLISWKMVKRVLAYDRVGFHPDDFDTTVLLDTWREELFGEHGELVDHLK